jgi:uncharacterized protein DUF1569
MIRWMMRRRRLDRMKKSLADSKERAAVVSRLQTLAPDSTRQWGRMTPHQAICHLSDSFRSMMNPVPITSRSNVFSRTFMRWIALHWRVPWPHGVKTMPEVDQEIGGTRPVQFERDRRELEALIEQFAQRTDATMQPHPMFGRLSTDEWKRWGYLHMDHHLRQFGA